MLHHPIQRLEEELRTLLAVWRGLRVDMTLDALTRYSMERQTGIEIAETNQALRLLRPHLAARPVGLSEDEQNLITRIEQDLGGDE